MSRTLLAVCLCMISTVIAVSAQSTAFTYQGFIKQDNAPTNGNYYFEFALYDQPTFGTQIGTTIVLDPVAVDLGSFTVELDFGNQFNGSNRYLEIRVRRSGSPGLQVLSPRKLITSTPNALNANSLGGLPAASYIQNTLTQQANANLNIGGNAIVGGNVGVGISTPNANLHIVGTPPPAVGFGDGTNAANALTIVGATGGQSGPLGGQGGTGADISIRAGDGGPGAQGSSAQGSGGSITLQPGLSQRANSNGKLILAPEGGNVGVGTAAPASKLDVNGTFSANAATVIGNLNANTATIGTTTPASASLTVVQSQPGITDPSPLNLPPAAIKGEATSTSNSNVGVIGIGNGSTGIGVGGITNGAGAKDGPDAIGVFALSTHTTGETMGVSSEVMSPNGTALDLNMPTGGTGYLIYASSGAKEGGSSTKFTVASGGQVNINGGMTLSGTFSSGQLTISNSNLQTIGNVQANNVTASQDVSVGGFLTAPGSTLQINKDVNLNGTLTPMLLSSGNNQLCNLAPTTTLRFCTSSLRYKSNVTPFSRGLDIIKRLNPISFKWNENGSADIGLSAEEVEKIEPILTFNNREGLIEGVRYNQLNAVFVNAFKEQQAQLEAQNKLIEEQGLLLKKFAAELKALKRKVYRKRR